MPSQQEKRFGLMGVRLLQPRKMWIENEHGQAIVEFALILPILLILLLLPIDFYRYIDMKMLLNSAASESLSQLDYASVSSGSTASNLMNTIHLTYGDQMDTGRVTINKLELGSTDTKNYTYYVYSSDKADPSNFWNQFEERPSTYQCQSVELQLSYELQPITFWGRWMLGSSCRINSRCFSRAIYAGGYATP